MREIKFRAWDRKKQRLIYQRDMIFFVMPGKKIPEDWKYIELMQYTGLKDINGKEIYEGDIIKGNYGDLNNFDNPDDHTINIYGKIFFDYCMYRIEIISGDKREGLVNYCDFILERESRIQNKLNSPCFNNIEVVGNIYENPELL